MRLTLHSALLRPGTWASVKAKFKMLCEVTISLLKPWPNRHFLFWNFVHYPYMFSKGRNTQDLGWFFFQYFVFHQIYLKISCPASTAQCRRPHIGQPTWELHCYSLIKSPWEYNFPFIIKDFYIRLTSSLAFPCFSLVFVPWNGCALFSVLISIFPRISKHIHLGNM